MGSKTKIAIQKIKNENVKTAVFAALELINAQQLMQKDNMVVLLKPNILMGKPAERSVNTHPEVIRAVIQWVKKFNPYKIYVSDSAGGQKPGITEIAMKESGIQDVCEEERFLIFDSYLFNPVFNKALEVFRKSFFPQIQTNFIYSTENKISLLHY